MRNEFKRLWRYFAGLFVNDKQSDEDSARNLDEEKEYAEKILDRELGGIRAQKEKAEAEGNIDGVSMEMVEDSFLRVKEALSEEDFVKHAVWIKYVKIAIYAFSSPAQALIDHIGNEYKEEAKQLAGLANHIKKANIPERVKNLEVFLLAFNRHILEINPSDIPALFAMGENEDRMQNYEEARRYYQRIADLGQFFALNSIVASYVKEINQLLSEPKSNGVEEKLKQIKYSQDEFFRKWVWVLKDRMAEENPHKDDKNIFCDLVASYSRFLKNTGRFKKALQVLEMIPQDTDRYYKKNLEKGLLYSYKQDINSLYNLNKAIEMYRKAYYDLIKTKACQDSKSLKSVLVPLSNALYIKKSYKEAAYISAKILEIDATGPKNMAFGELTQKSAS